MIDATPTRERQQVFNCVAIIPHKNSAYQVSQGRRKGHHGGFQRPAVFASSLIWRQHKAATKGTKYIQNLGFHLFSFISSPPVNAAGTFVTLLSLHLLNNSQHWGYHYSNLKVMTEREERGEKLFLEVKISKQLPFGHASRYVLKYHRAACSKKVRQRVEVC